MWLSSPSAEGKSAPHLPPSSRQTRTGRKRGKNITLHLSAAGAPLDKDRNTCTDLRVLQEGGLVIDAASGSVPQGILTVDPGAPYHLLLPGLVDAQVGGVDEAAQDQVCEVLAEVIKRHPAERRRKSGERVDTD